MNDALEYSDRYINNYPLWCKEQIGFTPTDYQGDAAKSLLMDRFITIKSGTTTGKTAFDATIGLWFFVTRAESKVVMTAPTGHQLDDLLMAEIRTWKSRIKFDLLRDAINIISGKIYIEGHREWFMVPRTIPRDSSDKLGDVIAGFHAPYLLFLMDEACHDDQTEILTDSGWKYFKDLNQTELVLSKNPDTDIAEYLAPTTYHEYQSKGAMLKYKARGSDFMVTPNHRMWCKTQKAGYRFCEASKLPCTSYHSRTMEFHGANEEYIELDEIQFDRKTFPTKRIPFILWAEFMGWYLSEGSVQYTNGIPYSVCITQSHDVNKYNCMDISVLLTSMGFKYTIHGDNAIIGSRQLAEYLAPFGKSTDKYVPSYMKDASIECATKFIDAYCAGDGYIKDGKQVIYTSSKHMADDLQEMYFKTGRVASITQRDNIGDKKWIKNHWATTRHINYIVSELKKSKQFKVMKSAVKEVPYSGQVYCVTLPKYGLLFTRRNGVCFWSGNSGIPDAVFAGMEGSMIQKNVYAAMTGNPTRATGYFYDSHNKNKAQWNQFTFSSILSPFVENDYVDRMRDIHGEDSDFFRTKVLGEFPIGGFSAIADIDTLYTIFENHKKVSLEEAAEMGVLVAGLDPAGGRGDYSVLTFRRGFYVYPPIRIKASDTVPLMNKVHDLMLQWSARELYIDYLGLGIPIYDMMRRRPGYRTYKMVANARANDPDGYANLRAELYGQLHENIREFYLPYHERYVQELPEIQIESDKRTNKMIITPKAELKSRLGFSPDYGDSLMVSTLRHFNPRGAVAMDTSAYFTLNSELRVISSFERL